MIYVDDYRGKFRGMVMSHLMSDTSLNELHEFAEALGLLRKWFQNHNVPHYDLSQSKRAVAIRLGAVAVSCKDRDAWRRVVNAARACSAANSLQGSEPNGHAV